MNNAWRSFKGTLQSFYVWLAGVTPDWDFVKAFFRSPLFSVVALLPILGFIIIQVSTFGEFLTENEEFSTYFEALTSNIVKVYWGSYYYIIAYAIYLLDPSPMIRYSRHADDFRKFVQTKNTPRLTINFIFQAATSDAMFGHSSKETDEFVDCVRNWINRVLDLSEVTIECQRETEYLLGRISGNLEADPLIQDDIIKFKNLLLDLSVKHHERDPWIHELNDNIGSIFYQENAKRPYFSRLLCLFWIAMGTVQIFGTVLWNHLQISAIF